MDKDVHEFTGVVDFLSLLGILISFQEWLFPVLVKILSLQEWLLPVLKKDHYKFSGVVTS